MKPVVLVTGAGRGIGAACAERFAADGHPVVLLGRGAAALRSSERRVARVSGSRSLLALAGDVSDEAFVRASFAATRRAFGPVEVLVNNAAVFLGGRVVSYGAADWDATMAANLRGPFLCSREMLRQFRRRGARRRVIVSLSSLAGVPGTEKFAGSAAYAASKAAVCALTEVLAVEGRPFGVDALALAPGAVETRMLRRAAPHLRGAPPAEIARVVAALAAGAPGLPSGATVVLDTNRPA